MSHFRLLISILLVSLSSFSHSQTITNSPAPDWTHNPDHSVESMVDLYDLASGFYFTALNTTVNYEEKTMVVRTKSKIVHNSGISEASQLYISFDTSFQTVKFHSFKIFRDGEVIDKSSEIELKVINEETQLESSMYTGIMAAHAIVEDVRKDDELELVYSISGQNPIYDDHYNLIDYLQGFNHIDHLTFRFLAPSDFDYDFRILSDKNLVVSKEDNSGSHQLNIVAENVVPALFEENMSMASEPFNFIEISSFSSWEKVQKWAVDLFDFPLSSEVKKFVNKVKLNDNSLTAQATEVYDYIQNKIRYTSVNGGIGSIKPSAPAEVLDRRYGDCKDKSLLLSLALKELGITDCYPVLVNTSSGKNLNSYLPGYSLFDHVIVKCELEGKTLWLDPSLSLQGGDITKRSAYDYGFGLPVSLDKAGLEEMEIIDTESKIEVVEYFDFSKVGSDGSLRVESTFTGINADYIRSMYDNYSPKDLADMFKQVYSTLFIDVRTQEKVKIEDDYEKNVFRMTETYEIGNPWTPLEDNTLEASYFLYEPYNVYQYISPTSCDSIQYAIDLNEHTRYYQKSNFKLPPDAIYKLNNFHTKNNAYDFRKEQKILSLSESVIEYDFKIVDEQIVPKDYYKICHDINTDCRNLLLRVVATQK